MDQGASKGQSGGMGRQAAQPAEGLHDGDDGIGVDDLKGDAAVGLIVAGRVSIKVCFIFIEIDHRQGESFLWGMMASLRENEAPGFM